MPNIVEFPSFTLKKGVTESDFLLIHEKFHCDFIAKQQGYISHKLLNNGEKWFDLVVWESMDATQIAFKDIYESVAAAELISLIDQTGSDEEIPLFAVVRNYLPDK